MPWWPEREADPAAQGGRAASPVADQPRSMPPTSLEQDPFPSAHGSCSGVTAWSSILVRPIDPVRSDEALDPGPAPVRDRSGRTRPQQHQPRRATGLQHHHRVLPEPTRQHDPACRRHRRQHQRLRPASEPPLARHMGDPSHRLVQAPHHASVPAVGPAPPARVAGAEQHQRDPAAPVQAVRSPSDPCRHRAGAIGAETVGAQHRRGRRQQAGQDSLTRRCRRTGRRGARTPTTAARSRTSPSAWPSRHRRSAAAAPRRPGSPPSPWTG